MYAVDLIPESRLLAQPTKKAASIKSGSTHTIENIDLNIGNGGFAKGEIIEISAVVLDNLVTIQYVILFSQLILILSINHS